MCRSRDTLFMQWRPPAFDGGSFVVSYRLEIRPLQPPDQVRPVTPALSQHINICILQYAALT